jgi:hypothetical protein
MSEKKQNHYASPDMSKLKSVIIDSRTRIYIPMEMSSEEARERYWLNRGVPRPDVVKA